MSNARPAPALLLVLLLVGVLIGVGLGFVLAPGQQPEARAGEAALRLDSGPTAPGASTGTSSGPVLPRGSGAASRDLAQAEAPAEVSGARLSEAVARVEPPSLAAPTGSGVIRGRITDADGSPIRDVTLVATPLSMRVSRPSSRSVVGVGAPTEESLEAALERAAESWASSRTSRRRQATGGDGSFTLDGLEERPYSISAYKQGWVLKAIGSRTVHPGDELNFSGTEARGMTLALRLPDGSVPTDVAIEVTVGRDTSTYPWSPEEPVVATTVPRFELRALAELIESPIYFSDTPSRFASEQQSVDLDELGGAPLVLQLEPRSGVFGRVRRAWPTSEEPNVVAVPVAEAASFDPQAPLENAETSRSRAGQYMILDLAPGLYAVGVRDTVRNGPPKFLAHELVTIGAGLTELDLVEPEPAAADHIVVHCLDSAGRRINDVSFTYASKHDMGSSSGGAQARRAPDGSFWLDPSSMAEFDYDSFPSDASLTLTASSAVHGKQSMKLSSGQREVTLQFQKPLSLEVQIAGYADSPERGNLTVYVNDAASEDDGWGNSLAQSEGRNGWSNGPKISDEGRVVFQNLSPGLLKVELMSGDGWRGNSTLLDSAEVELSGGDAMVQLRVPALHDLFVLAPGFGAETYLSLTPKGEDSPFRRGRGEQLDEDGRVTFKGLTAGTYLLGGGGGENLEVVVPCSEVLYEPKLPIGMRVIISKEGGTLYQAGLREGDVVVEVNGKDLSVPKNMNTLYQEFMQDSVGLLVERGGTTVSLSVGALNIWGGADTGGQLVPHYE